LFLATTFTCQADDTIRFPKPPPQESESAPKAEISQLCSEEWYVIQSDEPILVLSSPRDAVSIEHIQGVAILRGRFVDGDGVETRKIEGSHNYILSPNVVGSSVEILVIKTLDQGSVFRRTLELVESSRPDDAVVPVPEDEVSRAFDIYESGWRAAQKQLAERLRRGDIQTESDAADWMSYALAELRKDTFGPLLVEESLVFGGDLWTAEGHANYIMRYVRE